MHPMVAAPRLHTCVICCPLTSVLHVQGQRVTRPVPFALHQSLRPRDSAGQLSTEEMEMAEAQRNAFKSTPAPKHLHESRPLEGVHQVSTPRKPEEIFEVRTG